MNENKANQNAQVAELVARYREEIAALRAELEKKKAGGEKSPFYDGMDKVTNEVSSFAREHALSEEQAFAALYGEGKFMELLNKEKMKKAKIPALSQSGNAGEGEGDGVLSKSEAWAAKKAGMSLSDYLKYKK